MVLEIDSRAFFLWHGGQNVELCIIYLSGFKNLFINSILFFL